MSRKEEALWRNATENKLCRWCRGWPRLNNERCYRCGHMDGHLISRLTARNGLLSPSPACQTMLKRGFFDGECFTQL